MGGKAALVETISGKTGATKKQTTEFIDAFIDAITNELAAGEKIQLIGFGTFETRERKARKGRKPGTGETIDIPASVAPAFKPGKQLKEKVNSIR